MDDHGSSPESQHRRSSRRQAVSSRRSARKRGGGRAVTIGAIVVTALLVVAFIGVRTGAARMLFKRSGSSATTHTASGSATSATTGAAAKSTVGTVAPVSSAASATASSGPAWRNADPSWMKKYSGKLIDGFKPEPGYKAVALTFDDGPNGETQYVIDTLSKVGGAGTFFDTGRKLKMSWAKTQPSIISKGGFELGNHTQHHTINNVSSMWHRTYAVDLAEINGPDDIIKSYGGQPTVWLRPMGGMIDATGIKAAVDTNHLVINWTIDSNDSHGGPRTPDYLYNEVTKNIKSGDVVLMHVTHPETMKALPRIVATLNERGFKLVTLSELAQHSVAPITQSIPK